MTYKAEIKKGKTQQLTLVETGEAEKPTVQVPTINNAIMGRLGAVGERLIQKATSLIIRDEKTQAQAIEVQLEMACFIDEIEDFRGYLVDDLTSHVNKINGSFRDIREPVKTTYKNLREDIANFQMELDRRAEEARKNQEEKLAREREEAAEKQRKIDEQLKKEQDERDRKEKEKEDARKKEIAEAKKRERDLQDKLDASKRETMREKIKNEQAQAELERKKLQDKQAKEKAAADEKKRIADEEAEKEKQKIQASLEKKELKAQEKIEDIMAEKQIDTKGALSDFREDPDYEVVDFAKLTDAYKMENDKKIRQSLGQGIREIAGLRIFMRKTLVSRKK